MILLVKGDSQADKLIRCQSIRRDINSKYDGKLELDNRSK